MNIVAICWIDGDCEFCSSYCMHEFDVALYHNITLKRKRRLIVLMMLDNPAASLNADTDTGKDTLRQYVRQYTYIDYKAADWFDKLLYALPLHGMAGLARDDDTLLVGWTPSERMNDAYHICFIRHCFRCEKKTDTRYHIPASSLHCVFSSTVWTRVLPR